MIALALSNFTVTCLIVGLVASAVSLVRRPRPWGAANVVEALLAWFLFFSIGVFFLFNFIMHVFFGEMTARFIGWQNSPFQTELGFASLGYSAVGFLAWRGPFAARLAAVVGPACFELGAAGVHLYDMVAAQNFAPGNAGTVFYTDIGVPLAGLVLLALQRRHPPAPG